MEQRSNRASIIVAIITMLLILGGVFVLNQSMTRSRQATSNQSSSSSSSSSFSSSSSSEEEEIIEEEIIEEEEITDSSVSSSSLESTNPTANTGEIIATVDSRSAGTNGLTSYTFDIKASAYDDSTYFRSGRKTNLNLSQTNLEVGNSYRIAISFVDNNDGTFRVNSIRVVEPVQWDANATTTTPTL